MYFSIGRVFNLLMVVTGLLRFPLKALDMCYLGNVAGEMDGYVLFAMSGVRLYPYKAGNRDCHGGVVVCALRT
jgi:hypothetical protein